MRAPFNKRKLIEASAEREISMVIVVRLMDVVITFLKRFRFDSGSLE